MCKKTIFYGRGSKYVNIKDPNLLSVGDTITFKGTLYKDEEKTKEIGSSQNTWTITDTSNYSKIVYLSVRQLTITEKNGLLGKGDILVSSYGIVDNLTVTDNVLSPIYTTAESMITGGTNKYLGIVGTMVNISSGGSASLIFNFKNN